MKNLNLISKIFEKEISIGFKSKRKESFKLAKKIKEQLHGENKNYLLINLKEVSEKKIKKKTLFVSDLFGKRITQDKNKNRVLIVTPNLKILKKNNGNLKENIRYHQTNTGGSIHTDGPQKNKTPNILIMSCINNAKKGGHTILIDANKIYSEIKKKKPKYIKELSKDFCFERRGFNFTKNYLNKPILKKTKKNINFRYLREYIISGYQKAKKKITINQLNSINYLDKIMHQNKIQKKIKMKKGDLIIINNKNTAHGRTNFIIDNKNPRKFMRIWTN